MEYMKYVYYLKYMSELKMHQRKSKKDLSEVQSKRLRKMIRHAYNNVPFYRELFTRENIDPDSIRKVEDLQKMPITTKKDIQANYDKILAVGTDTSRCKIVNTTGSTGIPLKIWGDEKSTLYSSVLVYHAFFEAGLRMKDRFAELTGIIEDCSGTMVKKTMIPTFDPPEKIIDALRKYDPDMIYSFPSVFKILSHYLNEENKNGNGNNGKYGGKESKSSLNPRLIFTHGETLTEQCRETISSAFGADVLNTYGSTEFNRLGFECSEHSGIHMITDCAVTEIIKDGQQLGPGEEGDIIVTGLYNYAMPLIRYKLGDIGTMADYECSCGRSWPLIESIGGRSDDFLTLPSGRTISARTINVIEDIPGIVQYRTVQERRDKFVVQVIPGKDFSADSERQINEQIRLGCLGESVNVEIELLDEMPRERTGKLRAVVSKV